MASERKRVTGSILLVIAALFLTGLASGVALDRWLWRRPPETGAWWKRRQPEALVEKLRTQLALDDEQARVARDIYERRWSGMAEVLDRVDPELEAIRSRANDEIRALLTPEQRQRFEENLAKNEKKRSERKRSLMRRRLDR